MSLTLDKYLGLNSVVLVDTIKQEKLSKGGIIIPDTNTGRKARAVFGKVIKSAPENKTREGMTVGYREGLGVEIVVEDKPYLMLRENELLCAFQ